MKKLSFILAFILVFALLAACGEKSEVSNPDESRVDESVVVESSVAESIPDESGNSEPAKPIAISGSVISKGCKYEVPGGKGYVVNDDKWPANYTADLTDGIAVSELVYNNSWFSFNSEPDVDGEANRIDGVGTVIIDLGAIKSVTGVRTNVYTGNLSSIAPVGKVVVWVSEDGESYKNPVSLNIPEPDSIGWAEGGFEPVNARYIKVEYTVGGEGHHLFTNEIEVYGN